MKVTVEGSAEDIKVLFSSNSALTPSPARTTQAPWVDAAPMVSVPTPPPTLDPHFEPVRFGDTMDLPGKILPGPPDPTVLRDTVSGFQAEPVPYLEAEAPPPESRNSGPAVVRVELPGPVLLPPIKDEERIFAWGKFRDTVRQWAAGWEEEGAEQPDRVQLMRELGSGRGPVAILIMAYEMRSLQRMVEKALVEVGFKQVWSIRFGVQNPTLPIDEAWLDLLGRFAGHLTQVAHTGFPDLVGTLDYSSQWRRA